MIDQPLSWFRPEINNMQGYQPGEWPDLNANILKLNSNENPYPPSPQVLAALSEVSAELLRRYPDPKATDFCQVVGKTFGIPADWVIAGNGSDDLLTMLVRACAGSATTRSTAEKERMLAYPMPTYILYRTLAAIQPAKTVEIAYEMQGDNWSLPVEQLIAAQAALTLVATPNSPTGHCVPMADLRSLAAGLNGVLVIDEAYIDFAGEEAEQASLALVKAFENVIVLRTLSKGYGLAGLRLGFGIAQPPLLAGLQKVKDSYNVDAIALRLGAAAIADQPYKRAITQKVMAARQQLATDLQGLNFRVWPSFANFLLVQPPDGKAKLLCEKLKENQIMIRYFNQPGLDDKLRITVGTPAQNERMLLAIQAWL
ncbi:MAG: histidinol-phosphate transaminase [Phormidesmis priestleyi Ana]|uniref:Histidinol-phosphate aminotransferase n=1 Tax=Phormidesmis priestleyi Ana TaxID=1666911 RepID=A0A0P8DJR6_9CYAN|nr:MAG: histidinol-phosphate transaminase [Phormidesmis priestleyi Ana]